MAGGVGVVTRSASAKPPAGNLEPMDRRLDPQTRWNRDRRVASGPRLAQLLVTSDAVTFDELLAAAAPASVADVSNWIAHTIAGGLIEEVAPIGAAPRRFALRRTEAELEWRRRPGESGPAQPPA